MFTGSAPVLIILIINGDKSPFLVACTFFPMAYLIRETGPSVASLSLLSKHR